MIIITRIVYVHFGNLYLHFSFTYGRNSFVIALYDDRFFQLDIWIDYRLQRLILKGPLNVCDHGLCFLVMRLSS